MTTLDELPKGWIRLTLGEVGRWFGGGTPSKANSRFWTGGNIPWVSPKDMKSDFITDTQDHITEEAVEQSSTNIVDAGSVLVVVRSGILQHTLPVAVAQREVALNQDIKAVKPLEIIQPDYLAFALKAFEQDILHACTKTGTTVQSLELPIFLRFSIPVAPLAEQQRIVAKLNAVLSRVTAGEAIARRALNRVDRYRAAVLNAAVTGELTRDWRNAHQPGETGAELLGRLLQERRACWEATELKRLKSTGKQHKNDKWKTRYREPIEADAAELASLPKTWTWASPAQLSSGEAHSLAIGPFGSNLKVSDYRETGVPLVFVRNIRTGSFSDEKTKYVSRKKAKELEAHQVKGGDLLITKMGDPPGDACIYPENAPTAIITADCIRLKVSVILEQSKLLFVHGISSSIGHHQILRITSGVAQQKVSLARFSGIGLPLPPLTEQFEIVCRVESRLATAERLTSALNRQLERARITRHSLLREAFSGKIVAQDPNDEPCSVLLERISAARKTEPKKTKLTRMPKPKLNFATWKLFDLIDDKFGGKVFTFDALRKEAYPEEYEDLRAELYEMLRPSAAGGPPVLQMMFDARKETMEFKLIKK